MATSEAAESRYGAGGCPDEGDLLRLIDGELAPVQADAVRHHIHVCWSCRARYEELKATVRAFVELVEGPVRQAIPAPPRQWTGFRRRLRAVAGERRVRSRVSRLIGDIGRRWSRFVATVAVRRVVISGATAALVALFLAFVPGAPRLAAQEILDRAIAADAQRVASVTRPVTRRRFEASRRVDGRVTERATWVLYCDLDSGRSRAYAASGSGTAAATPLPPLVGDVLQLLAAHDWDARSPLSSASYDGWQRSVGAATDYTRVMIDGGRAAYRVQARAPGPVRSGAIAAASIVIRADDWHAVRQSLEVPTATGVAEFQLAELAFDVLRFDSLEAAIFGEAASVAEAAPPAPRVPSVAELDMAEMAARYALHRQGADRGEPIGIARGASRVTVRGLVNSTKRARDLEAALSDVPHVTVDFTALDRIGAGTPAPAPPVARAVDEAPAIDPQRLHRPVPAPLQATIDAFLLAQDRSSAAERGAVPTESDAARRNAFVARVLADADRTIADAWGLRHLADRYPQEAVDRLDQRSSDLLEEMVRDHVRALIVSTSAWRAEIGLLAPFASARLGEASTAMRSVQDVHVASFASEPWPSYAMSIFGRLLRAQKLTTDGFIGAAPPEPATVVESGDAMVDQHGRAPERHLLELLDDLTALERALRHIDDEARQGRRLIGATPGHQLLHP